MPIYSVQGPDGRIYDVEGPAGASEAQVIAYVREQLASRTAPVAPKKQSGVLASAAKGIESLISSGRTAFGAATGDANQAALAGLARGEDISRRYADDVSLEKVKKAYEERGLLPAAGEALSQIPKAIAEQAPNIASTLGGARLGAMAGSPFGPVGTVIGGAAGAVLPGLVGMFGSNVERQAAEQQQAGQPVNVSTGRAAAAAVPQAALDAAATFIPLGGRVVSKLTGIPVEAMVGKTAAQAAKLAEERLLATLAKGTATGVLAEVPTEIAQQMLERAQAGLSLTTPDALKEYGETAYQVSLLAPIGAAGRFSEKAGARQKIEEQQLAERQRARQETLRQEAESAAAEEARKQTPEYAGQVQAQYLAMEGQIAELRKQLRKIEKGSPTETADREFNREIQAQIKELAPQLKAAAQEYNRVQPLLKPLQDQQRADQIAQELTQLRQQMDETPGTQATIPGLEPMETEAPPAPTSDEEARRAAASTFAQKSQEMAQLLESQQQLESAAAERGDIEQLKQLRQRRTLLQNEYEFVTKQLNALGGAPVSSVDAIQKQIADLTAKLQAMGGPGYDPVKADKLLGKIEELQGQLKAAGAPEGAGRQSVLDMGRATRETFSESTPAFNLRTYEPGGYQGVERDSTAPMADFAQQSEDIDVERRQGQTDAELAQIERQARMDTTRSEQGTLFGEEAKTGIQTGMSAASRAELVNNLRIARAARNAMPSSRRAGSTEAVSQALEALRDFDARAAAESERGTTKIGEVDANTQTALAGATVPAREAAVQSARTLRDSAYADIVELVSQYNRGKAKQEDLMAAKDKLVNYAIKEVELRNGESLPPELRRAFTTSANALLQDLISRFGDTRTMINVGTAKEPRYVSAQNDKGEFRTDYGGPGTGPSGMGLANIESRAPGDRTFGSPYAAAKSIQEGLDQLINRLTTQRTGSVERAMTPAKVTADALRKQLARAKEGRNEQAKMLAERVEDNFAAIAKDESLVQDISQFLSRAAAGQRSPELLDEINARLDTLEQGKRSETEQQADGTTKTAVQGELFRDANIGQVFDTPEQFRDFMASDALNTMRQLKGIPGETAERILVRLEPLRKQIAAYEQQIDALRAKYEQAVGQRTQAGQMGDEARSALQQAKALRTQMMARFEKRLAEVEADYVRASLKYNFTSKVLDDLGKLIQKNMDRFEGPLDGLEKRYFQEIMDAERASAREQNLLRERLTTGLPARLKWMREAKFTPKQVAAELGLNKDSLALLEELAAQPAFKRGILNKRTKAWMSDARVIAALDEHARLSMELQAEEKTLPRLGRDLMNASLALQEARAQMDSDPRVKARLDRQQALVEKAQGDITAARELLGESDATVRAVAAQIGTLGDMQDRLSRIVKGTEKQVAARANERVTKDIDAETIGDREARDAEARKAEQAKLEKEADTPNRKTVSFEPRRAKEEKRVRNAEQLRQLEEQVEFGTAEEKAAAQAALDAFRAKLEKMEAGAAKKLQGAINTQNKLADQIRKNAANLASENLPKSKRAELEERSKSLNTQLKAVGERINKALGSVVEDVPTRADKQAERAEQYAEATREQIASLKNAESTGRLPARRIGPVAKKAVQAGNVRTGDTSTSDERRLSTRNTVRQEGLPRPITPKQATTAATKTVALEQAMLRDSALSEMRDKVETALEKAQQEGNKEAVAKRKDQLKRLDREIEKNAALMDKAAEGTRLQDAPTPDDFESLFQLAKTGTQGAPVRVEPESNAANVMDEITATSTSPLNRVVAERLRTLLGGTKVTLVENLKDDDGNPAYGSAKVDGSEILLDARDGLNEQTVLHEGVHAAVERALRMPDAQLTEDQRAAKRELQELYDAFKADKNAPNENAKTSLSEFVSEALSDAPLQNYLQNKKWTLKNMWNAVKNGILKMIGVDVPTNMRDATLAAADRLMMRTVRPTAADANLSVPTVPRRKLNPALAGAYDVADGLVAKQQSWAQNLKAQNTGLAFITRYVDRFAGYEQLAKQMGKPEGTQMLYFLRMYDQRMNFVAQSAGNGALELRKVARKDGETEYVIESKEGASLRTVVETLKQATPLVGDVDATNRLFTMYLAAKRADRVGFSALNFGKGLTEAQLKEAVKSIDNVPGLKDIFDAARDEYNQYNEGLVRFAQQSGALSKSTADKLLASKDYIPYYRQTRDGGVELVLGGEQPIRVGSIKEQPYLQELVGGDEPIIDFFNSSVQNTNLMVDMALRNLATKKAVMELVSLKAAVITPSQIAGPDVVKFKVDGQDRYARIDTDEFGIPADILVKGMEGIPLQLTGVMRLAAMPSQLLRRAVTLNPMYAARQLFRDSLAAPILAGADFSPVLGALREIGSAAGKTLERRGVVGGQYFTGTSEDLSKIMREIAEGKSGWAKALGKLETFGMEADALTRRAQYNSYIKQGMSEMEATLASLESMNFNKRGASPSIHMVNALIPFFNAQIQGLNVLYRALTGKATAAEKLRLQSKLLTRGGTMMALSLIYTAAMQDDEAYKNATPDQKYGNWFIRVPGVDEPIKLPVPFEVGYIFKALPEALYNSIANGEAGREEAVEALKGILRNVIPGGSSYGIPQFLKPAIEVGLGKSFYTGRDLLSGKEKTLRPEEQFRDNTSEIAKAFGAATGLSPIKVEALVSGYTGSLGLAALQLGNIGFGTDESPEKVAKRLSDMPIVGSAFQPNDAGYIINRAYDRLAEASQVKASVDSLLQKGEKAKAMALLQEKGNEYALSSTAGWFTQAMGKLTQYEAAIKASDRSPEEKRELLDRVRQSKIRLAASVREAVDKTTPQ